MPIFCTARKNCRRSHPPRCDRTAADRCRRLISLLRFEIDGSIADLVSSAAELYFLPGTVNFGIGGNYTLEWGGKPEIVLDLEIKPRGVTVYAQLALASTMPASTSIISPFRSRPSILTRTPPSSSSSLRESRYDARPLQALAG